MPTAIFDSSYITFRKRAGVLNAYKSTITAASLGDYNFVRTEQPTLQTAEIISTRKQGGCICAQDSAGTPLTALAPALAVVVGKCGYIFYIHVVLQHNYRKKMM
jgi:hypothetical protein